VWSSQCVIDIDTILITRLPLLFHLSEKGFHSELFHQNIEAFVVFQVTNDSVFHLVRTSLECAQEGSQLVDRTSPGGDFTLDAGHGYLGCCRCCCGRGHKCVLVIGLKYAVVGYRVYGQVTTTCACVCWNVPACQEITSISGGGVCAGVEVAREVCHVAQREITTPENRSQPFVLVVESSPVGKVERLVCARRDVVAQVVVISVRSDRAEVEVVVAVVRTLVVSVRRGAGGGGVGGRGARGGGVGGRY